MITNFEIENFKAFAKKQSLNFAPITLIFGPNSSGKSSIIQSLMMLKQTVLSKDKNAQLVTSGESINLGTFDSLVHGQDAKKKMSFSIKYTSNHVAKEYRYKHSYEMLFGNKDIRQVDFRYRTSSSISFLDKYSFSCKSMNIEKVSFELTQPTVSSEGITFSLSNNESLAKAIIKHFKIKSSDGKNWIEAENSSAKPFKVSSNLNIPTILSDTGTPASNYTAKIVDDIKYVFTDLKYLGPLRSAPKKFYSNEINNYQKGQGKHNLGLAIASASSNVKPAINEYLKKFHIPYTIDAKDLGDINTGPLISLQLTDTRNGAVITPKDVGFGIGQVLPIIFEAVISENKHICVEQPEIHLHPRLQAHLADLFIDSVQNGNNQWIAETHSEALMLRIQRRIREGVIPKEMVSVLYVDVGDSGAQVTPISLNDNGDFTTAWPEGFFEERLEEIFGV